MSGYLRKIEGDIVAVGFEPGKTFVSIKSKNKIWRGKSSQEDVEKAFSLRGAKVAAQLLIQEKICKLLWISAENKQPTSTPEERSISHHEKWGKLLKRLA